MRTIITLAHNLGVSVIAEGVETDEQRRWLRAEGCDLAQGYLAWQTSVAAEVAEAWLEAS